MNRLTMPELPAVADLLVEIGARSWMVILTTAMGRAADRPSLLLHPYHLLIFSRFLRTSNAKNSIQAGSRSSPATMSAISGRWQKCSATAASSATSGRLRRRRLGTRDRGGRPDQRLPVTTHIRLCARKHRERSLRDIASQLRREKTESPVELWGFCKTCPFAARCKGGCTWTSHVLFGRPGNNPFCHSRALAMAAAGLVEKIEPVTAAPGEPFDFGCYRIVEAPLGPDIEADPVIGMTKASQVFGLSADAKSLWSKRDLSDTLDDGRS